MLIETLKENLVKAGFSRGIIEKGQDSLPLEYAEQLKVWKKAVSREKPVTIVEGVSSVAKDVMIMCMALEFLKVGKSVQVVLDFDENSPPNAFALIVLFADIQPNKLCQQLATYLPKHVYSGRAVIIDCHNLSSLKAKYGDLFVSFILQRSVVVKTKQLEETAIVI